MNKLDPKKPHLRFVTYKTITDANGITRNERTFVLVPMKAKPKTILTKEQVHDKKINKIYESTGQRKDIPTTAVEKDAEGNIIPVEDIYTVMGKQTLQDYRTLKKKLDDETTETITLSNGFKKKIKIKLEFRALPSMKLSPVERKTRMEEHRKSSQVLRLIKKANVKSFKENPKPYVYEPYTLNTKARKERQSKFWSGHNKKIMGILEYLKEKKKGATLRIDKVLKQNTEYTRKTVKPKVPFDNGMKVIENVVKNNKAKDAVHVFGINRKDNIPAMGMKIAA